VAIRCCSGLLRTSALALGLGPREPRRAGPAVSKRDRLAIQGEPTSVITLLRQILPEVGPSFRTIGDRDLVHLVVRELVELDVVLEFGWMDTTAPPSIRTHDAEWLDEKQVEEIGRLLDRAFPDSYARPCEPGYRDGLAAG
jgi:hypothetical protein